MILLYKRHDHIQTLISSCSKMGVEKFYFAIDGPLDEIDRKNQEMLISRIHVCCGKSNTTFKISRLSKNRGIFVNMVTALEWFFEENSFGVILEDDTLPDVSFADFVQANKLKLDSNSKTLLISGWRGAHSSNLSDFQSEYCSYPLIWGWATSREKWMIMRKWFFERSYMGLDTLSNCSPSRGFWFTGYSRAISGKLDSWANVLAFNFLIGGFKSIVPKSTLITNVGFDEFSTNTQIRKRERLSHRSKSEQLNLPLDDWLAKEVFHISYRHIFAPIYAPIIDFILRRKPKREPPRALLRHSRDQVDSALDLRNSL